MFHRFVLVTETRTEIAPTKRRKTSAATNTHNDQGISYSHSTVSDAKDVPIVLVIYKVNFDKSVAIQATEYGLYGSSYFSGVCTDFLYQKTISIYRTLLELHGKACEPFEQRSARQSQFTSSDGQTFGLLSSAASYTSDTHVWFRIVDDRVIVG
ncbi:hypothetical protein FRC18_002182 [Serendipita sp. 400]|nr:hypothetical protein FRC18_002182 [Serendipita sp. 400]